MAIKSTTPNNIQKVSTIQDGILNVYALLNEKEKPPWDFGSQQLNRDENIEKNLDKIIETIKKCPITYSEAVWDCIENGNWERLLTYHPASKAETYQKIATSVIVSKNKEGAKRLFNNFFGTGYTPSKNEGKVPKRYLDSFWYSFLYKTLDDRVAPIKKVKQSIIDDLNATYKMYRKTDSLNTNHFNELLEKGNYRDLTIDLCVRMEERFKGQYKLNGTLMQMLEKYLNDIRRDRQEYNNTELMWTNLSKLIRCRNNLVHRNESNETMSYKELKSCIEYVVKI